MRKFLILAAASAALVSTPVLAQDANDSFTGVRAGLTAGFDDVTGTVDGTDVVYGADVGVDIPVGDRMTFGVEAFSTNPFDDDRTVGAAARVGYAFNEDVLGFARAGYSNYETVFDRNLDALTVGGGLEFAASKNTYARIEYRYSDFEAGVGNHGALAAVGVRF